MVIIKIIILFFHILVYKERIIASVFLKISVLCSVKTFCYIPNYTIKLK